MSDTSPTDTAEPETFSPPDDLALLRELWALTPENLRGKLPKPYKKDAEKGSCKECGGYHGLPALHLDYLGHADTCRLIAEKDILWQWEPMAGWDAETGEPKFVRDRSGYPIALWIKLTICGVTRPGVGTVTGNKPDPEKELIGDAIRNAAMRFGVGADMWSKAHHVEAASDDSPNRTYDRRPAEPFDWFAANGWKDRAEYDAARKLTNEALAASAEPVKVAFRAWWADQGHDWKDAWPKPLADAVTSRLEALIAERPDQTPKGGGPPNPVPTPETPAPAPESAPVGDSEPLPDPDPTTMALITFVESLPARQVGDALEARNAALSGASKVRQQRLAKLLAAEGWTPGRGHLPVTPETPAPGATVPPGLPEPLCAWCGHRESTKGALPTHNPEGGWMHDDPCRPEWVADKEASEAEF